MVYHVGVMKARIKKSISSLIARRICMGYFVVLVERAMQSSNTEDGIYIILMCVMVW